MASMNAQIIADNLARLRQRMAKAAESAGRGTDDVQLVAVTKYVGPAEVQALIAAGCHELGESRPQALWDKAETASSDSVHWHLIGHLQRNKVRRTLPLVELIHSVDSIRLLSAIDTEAGLLGATARVLLEVNVSGDSSKHGFAVDEIEPVLPQLPSFAHVEVRGLMAMAALAGGTDRARGDFAQLRRLRDRLQTSCPPGTELKELSMGMTRDFEQAIAEGATIVRVGSALFEGL